MAPGRGNSRVSGTSGKPVNHAPHAYPPDQPAITVSHGGHAGRQHISAPMIGGKPADLGLRENPPMRAGPGHPGERHAGSRTSDYVPCAPPSASDRAEYRSSPRRAPPRRFGHDCAWLGCSAGARCEACRFRAAAGWVCVLADARLDVVARVDPDDDNLRRYVVHHYRHDPERQERQERRHVVVAASGSRRQFGACLDAVSQELGRRGAAGGQVDPGEHVSRDRVPAWLASAGGRRTAGHARAEPRCRARTVDG